MSCAVAGCTTFSPPALRGRLVVAVSAELLPEFLGTLVTQIGAAAHQDRGQQPGQELTEQQRGGQDDQQLVP